ncbi:glycosyltransferase [Nostoc sp. C117]|uniref:glycosyltransferase n=1 Tax=Nostoc sp. C117 TaxID=3349875 RepID=UPI00370D6181
MTEAGNGIGFGHFMRCSAIQEFIQEKGVETDIYLDIHGETDIKGNFIVCKWRENFSYLLKENLHTHVLVDSYIVKESALFSLKNNYSKVIALDDYHRLNYGVDLIINPNIFGNSIYYNIPSVGGKEFIILRQAFRKERHKVVIKEKIKSILLTLGGSDYRDLLPNLIFNLVSNFPEFNLHVVSGNFDYMEQLKQIFKDYSSLKLYGFLDGIQMKNLILSCDLAISACGQTLHELAYLGLPTIGICIDKDQELNMIEYSRLGFLLNHLYWNQANLYKTLNRIIDIYQSLKLRISISQKGISNIYCNGLENIFEAIFK